MKIIKPITAVILALVFTLTAMAKDKPFAPVEDAVKQRTKRTVRWEEDMAARADSQAQARVLLKKPLTVSSAVQIALLNNRELQATFGEIGLSYADVRQARTLANPAVDLSVKFPNAPPTHPLYEWGIAQNFLDLLMLPLRTRVASAQLAAAQFRVSDSVVKIIADVKTAYYELQADQSLLARLRIILDAQESSLQLMQKIHAAGNTKDLNLAREQAAYSQARLEVAMAESEGRAHREKLNRLLGAWGNDTTWKITGELPPVPDSEPGVKRLETLAVGNRLDLAAARSELESAVKALGLEKKFRFIGVLDFGLVGEHDPDGVSLVGPAIRFELPIFNQGQARIARGEAQLSIAQSKFEQLAIDVRSDVRELRDRLITKRDIARFYRDELLPTRQRIVGLTLLEYNGMLLGAFELFTAKREEIEAEHVFIQATRDYWITRAALERAVGGDLESGPRSQAKPSTTATKSSTSANHQNH